MSAVPDHFPTISGRTTCAFAGAKTTSAAQAANTNSRIRSTAASGRWYNVTAEAGEAASGKPETEVSENPTS
jgi:hypothetical protein